MRGCDSDEAIYWLKEMIDSGGTEIYRQRMVIFALEDVGLANSKALTLLYHVLRNVRK
jgi:replication-associated recombination protein RarA